VDEGVASKNKLWVTIFQNKFDFNSFGALQKI
jgi:hypothetical protein